MYKSTDAGATWSFTGLYDAGQIGAVRVDPQPGETWIVLQDPAGHPFCLTDASAWG